MGYKHHIDDILKIGTELIRTNGYHNVGINEILKACQIPKGSFYNFFETKEDFAKQLLDFYGSNSKKMIERFLSDTSLSPINRLKSFYRMLIDANETDRFMGGCLLHNLSNEIGRLNDTIAEAANENFDLWMAVISGCVEEGQVLNEITKDYTADYIAEYLHSGLYGALSRSKTTRSINHLDQWYTMTFDFIGK